MTILAKPGPVTSNGELTLRVLASKDDVKSVNGRLYLVKRGTGTDYVYFPIRKNGTMREWKTRPNRWEQPCKYGLRDCFRVTNESDIERDGQLAVIAE